MLELIDWARSFPHLEDLFERIGSGIGIPRIADYLEHDPEKLADFSDKIMGQNKEKQSAIDSI